MKELWPMDPRLKEVVLPPQILPDKTYRPSIFAYRFSAGSRRCLFHVLTRQCLDLEGLPFPERRYTGDELRQSAELGQLLARRFLVPEEEDESEYYQSIIRLLRLWTQKKGYRNYTILPTTACNARCVYCFEEGMKQVTMTAAEEEALIAFIRAEHVPGDRVQLSWFGGEPLLCAGTIDRVCQALADAEIPYRSSVITNGSLIDENILEKMTGLWNMRTVQLSMDCDEEEYYRRKRYLRPGDQYRQVIRAADRMAQRGIWVTIRCNLDRDNLSKIDAFLEDLDRELTKKDRISVYFLPLYDAQRQETCAEVWAACEAAEYRLRDLGFRCTAGTRLHRLKLEHCMSESPYENLVVAPDGLLYLCEHCPPGCSVGTLKEGITDPALLASYSLPEQPREECRSCCFLPECTSFTRCPVKRAICRDVEESWLRQALTMEAAKLEGSAPEGPEAADSPVPGEEPGTEWKTPLDC